LAPPYIVSDGEIEVIVERLGAAVDAAVAGVGGVLGGGGSGGGGSAAGVAGSGGA
jgi:hypothetical protein